MGSSRFLKTYITKVVPTHPVRTCPFPGGSPPSRIGEAVTFGECSQEEGELGVGFSGKR